MFKTTRSSAPSLSDEEILQREIEWARAQMTVATARVKQGAIQAADPTAWAKQHPWATVGAAAAAGFLAAGAVNKARKSKREEQIVARYLRRLQQAMPGGAGLDAPGASAAAPPKRGLMSGLVGLMQTVILQVPTILSHLQAAHTQADAAEAQQNAAEQTAGNPQPDARAADYEMPRAETAGY
ncbi:MAG: hypothetical protein QM775_07900 [Pirellulales bacterium]